MAAIPQPINATAAAVAAWRVRTTDTSHRPHLGASLIGHPCDKYLWLVFRWSETENFDGRMLRLFDTGRREEARVHEELRGIGCEVWADDGGAQFRVSTHGGHFGGSMDGVVQGLPEAPKTAHVLEVKTYSDKTFAALVSKGVREAKPQHWWQMQTYMELADLDRSLYYAVNKNTDALHIERVERDRQAGASILARAKKIIEASEPPLGVSTDPSYFECKWCKFYEQCHGTAAPEVNCRTCVHSTPETGREGATWTCGAGTGRGLVTLPLKQQRTGCDMHLFIPPMLANIGQPVDGTDNSVAYQARDGGQFVNGPAPGFTSHEIRAAQDKRALTDPAVQSLKRDYGTARVVA